MAHDASKGEPQGQRPQTWIKDGLVDAVVPATHNHEPDSLDWSFDEYSTAAVQSPQGCVVWPQIWPTGEAWQNGAGQRHSNAAVIQRVRQMRNAGAQGVYFFNFREYNYGELTSGQSSGLFDRLWT